MPTYSYRCSACEHDFDQYQAFTDDSLTDCPSCGEPELRKVFSSIGVTFTGSGFYRNDSREAARTSDSAKAKSESGASKSDAPSKSADSAPAKSSAGSSGSSGSGSSGSASLGSGSSSSTSTGSGSSGSGSSASKTGSAASAS